MANNTNTKNVIKSPQEYYREKERKRYAEFCANLKADLSKTDLHPKTKDKYFVSVCCLYFDSKRIYNL